MNDTEGSIQVDITGSNPERAEESEIVTVLAGTKAMLRVLPSEILVGLGIRHTSRQLFHASGERLERDTGIVAISYAGSSVGVSALFGTEDSLGCLVWSHCCRWCMS